MLTAIEAWPQAIDTVDEFDLLTPAPIGEGTVAGHRVEALGADRSRLTLTFDMRGLLVPVVALSYRHLTNDYMIREAQGMKRAAEHATA